MDPAPDPADGSADGTAVRFPHVPPRSAGYLRLLLTLLLTASFFDGYDDSILDLIAPNIQSTFGLSEAGLGIMRFIIKSGAIIAFVLVIFADRWGRRPLLLWSVLGYTIMTGLTAFAPNVYVFTACQFLAQIFLGAEYAVAVTMISEEFPSHRRAWALGVFSLVFAMGALLVAVLDLSPLTNTPLEWRTLYLVGLLPLLLTAVLRRRMKETRLFEAHRRRGVALPKVPFRETFSGPWKQPYRRNMLILACITMARSLPLFGATAWWVWYAEREALIPRNSVLIVFMIAYTLGIAGHYVCGRSIERWGRKPVTVVYALIAWVAATALFQTSTIGAQTVLLVLAVFFGLGMAPALNAFFTETFPTRVRASATAWARNGVEIPGKLLGPLIIALLGDHGTGIIGSIGDATTVILAMLPAVAFLVWRYLPETRGRDLEALDGEVQA